MIKKGKIKTILDAFTKESKIDKDILKNRRSICEVCPYNSNNVDSKDLSTVNKARKKVISSPFCTACGCQINEKTLSETEECGLSYINKIPKWNRVKLETVGKLDFNILNKSVEFSNVYIEESVYVLDLGNVEKSSSIINTKLILNNITNFDILSITPSCGSCTSVDYNKLDSNNLELNINLDISKLPNGRIHKNVYIVYTLNNNNTNTSQIRIVGNVKN